MANLTVTIQEDLTINSAQAGGTITHVITGINDVYKRTVSCASAQSTTLVTFAESEHTANGALSVADTRYIRLTNLDTTNSVEVAYTLGTLGEEASLFQATLGPGSSHVYDRASQLALIEADGSPSFGTMGDLSKIIVRPIAEGAAVRVEVFIASV